MKYVEKMILVPEQEYHILKTLQKRKHKDSEVAVSNIEHSSDDTISVEPLVDSKSHHNTIDTDEEVSTNIKKKGEESSDIAKKENKIVEKENEEHRESQNIQIIAPPGEPAYTPRVTSNWNENWQLFQ
jgi:hypothetical protein